METGTPTAPEGEVGDKALMPPCACSQHQTRHPLMSWCETHIKLLSAQQRMHAAWTFYVRRSYM